MGNVVLRESSINGTGVFASTAFKKGQPILKIDDTRVVTNQDPLHPEDGEFEYHCDYLANGKVVLMQVPERHINHSCEPNTFVKTIHGFRYVFALREIPAGVEVTYDYCINGFGDVVWECNCGSERCRHTIHSDFFHLPPDLQLEYLPLLDDWYLAEYEEKVLQLLRTASV